MSPRRNQAARNPGLDECAVADVRLVRAFGLLGKRWTAVLLGTLGDTSQGFSALSRAIPGISDSVLSDRLAELSAARLIARRVQSGPPISVTYALTDAGKALLPALEQVSLWAEQHLQPSSADLP